MMQSVDKWVAERLTPEVLARLTHYQQMLLQWQKAINLVSPGTLDELWDRHFQDSLQVAYYLSQESRGQVMDVGSGGGFPGMVCAIILGADYPFTLVESDRRKGEFLRAVSRETQTPIALHLARIEQYEGDAVQYLTARGFAALPSLLSLCSTAISENTISYLLKGKEWQQEVDNAQKTWHFELDVFNSITHKEGRLLRLSSIRRG